ncbi:MAG TPA: DUF1499 domain-containing protein [Geobacteraceae bacterium]
MAPRDKSGIRPGTGSRRPFLLVPGGGLALVAVIVLAGAGFGYRLGLWQFRTGFALLRYGAWCGLAAAAASLGALIAAGRRRRFFDAILALAGLAIGIAAFSVPLQWKLTAQRLPRIHDITTDVGNPPQFVAILPLRKDAPNPAAYGGAEIAIKQRAAYPDLKTAVLDLTYPQAFDQALDAARRMGWKIVAAVPAEGRIEATDTTFWFGFTDDIVIRVTSAGNRSLADIRSVSRVGVSDAGTNAKRIHAYLRKLTGTG